MSFNLNDYIPTPGSIVNSILKRFTSLIIGKAIPLNDDSESLSELAVALNGTAYEGEHLAKTLALMNCDVEIGRTFDWSEYVNTEYKTCLGNSDEFINSGIARGSILYQDDDYSFDAFKWKANVKTYGGIMSGTFWPKIGVLFEVDEDNKFDFKRVGEPRENYGKAIASLTLNHSNITNDQDYDAWDGNNLEPIESGAFVPHEISMDPGYPMLNLQVFSLVGLKDLADVLMKEVEPLMDFIRSFLKIYLDRVAEKRKEYYKKLEEELRNQGVDLDPDPNNKDDWKYEWDSSQHRWVKVPKPWYERWWERHKDRLEPFIIWDYEWAKYYAPMLAEKITILTTKLATTILYHLWKNPYKLAFGEFNRDRFFYKTTLDDIPDKPEPPSLPSIVFPYHTWSFCNKDRQVKKIAETEHIFSIVEQRAEHWKRRIYIKDW